MSKLDNKILTSYASTSILGNGIKTLYINFCYANAYYSISDLPLKHIYLLTQALATEMVVGGSFLQTAEAVTGKVTVLVNDFSKLSRHPIWTAS